MNWRGPEVSVAFANGRKFVLYFLDCVAVVRFLNESKFIVEFVIQLIFVLLLLVPVDSGDRLRTQHCLRTVVLFQLEDEFIYFLSSPSDVAFVLVGNHSQFMKFFLELGDLQVFIFYLIFLHSEKALHVLVLFFKRYDVVITAPVLFK